MEYMHKCMAYITGICIYRILSTVVRGPADHKLPVKGNRSRSSVMAYRVLCTRSFERSFHQLQDSYESLFCWTLGQECKILTTYDYALCWAPSSVGAVAIMDNIVNPIFLI